MKCEYDARRRLPIPTKALHGQINLNKYRQRSLREPQIQKTYIRARKHGAQSCTALRAPYVYRAPRLISSSFVYIKQQFQSRSGTRVGVVIRVAIFALCDKTTSFLGVKDEALSKSLSSITWYRIHSLQKDYKATLPSPPRFFVREIMANQLPCNHTYTWENKTCSTYHHV